MYTNASNELNQMIENVNNNSLKARIVFADGSTIDKINKLVFYGGSNKSDAIQIGSTTMAYFEASIETDRLLTNEEVTLECGAKLTDGTEEYIPIGKFTFQKPVGDIDGVEVVANDRMQRFERVYSSSLTYPTTSAEVLNELCTICGVTLATPIENPIEITDKLDGYTCREVLGFISALHGKFACIDRFGQLNVRWYSDSPITKETRVIWSFTKAEHNTTIDKVEIHKNTEVSYTSGSGFNVLFNSNPYATQESTDNVFNGINGFTYNASKIELVDDIRLDCWDVIKVPYLDGNEYLVPCMALTQDFSNGSTIIQAFSKSEVENKYNYTGAISNYIERVAYELLLANKVIATKVDADYVNAHAITTENFEAKIAEITHLVVQEIDGKYADIELANIDIANINKANIGLLFAEVGLLDRATIVDGHITGFLDAVEINANKITAGTLMVDRLIFRGSEESIIYELNRMSRNLIPYPYKETTHIDNGITWTDLGDGTVKANGTATANSDYILFNLDKTVFEVGTYTISGMPEDSTSTTYFIYLNWYKDGTFNKVTSFAKETTFTLTEEDINTYTFRLALRVLNGKTVNDVIFKPMLSKGTEVLPYEPYRERTQALTSETVNGEVLTDRTITADKIIAKSITSNEIDVAQLFADEAAIRTLVAQSIFTDAIETNRIVVGKANRDEVVAENLLEFPYYNSSMASNGITFTVNADGTVKANGTATANATFIFTHRIDNKVILPKGTYTVSGCPSGGSASSYHLQIAKTENNAYTLIGRDVGNGFTFTLTQDTDIYIAIHISSGAVIPNLIFKPMLEKGSVAHPYQQYLLSREGLVGQMYADNLLEFPYYNSSMTTNGITFTVNNNDGSVKANGTASATANFIFTHRIDNKVILPKGTYTVSGCPSGGASNSYCLQVARTLNNSYNLIGVDTGKGFTFTLEEETDILIAIYIASGVTVTNIVFKPMLEIGSIAHPYTEYKKGGTGLANNIYYQGTTLIDGGNIYTGTVTAEKIATDAIKSKNYVANTSGSFLNLADGSFDSKYLKWNNQGELTATKGYLGNWEIKERSLISVTDKGGSYDTEWSALSVSGTLLDIITQSTSLTEMSLYIREENSSNGDESYARYHRLGIDAYYNGSDYAYPLVYESKSELGIGAGYGITKVKSNDGLASTSDVYANYGLDTQVSLLGLKEKVDYLQPHPYSLITRAELTSSQTTFTVTTGRKISDYGMLMITMGANANEVRAEVTIPRTIFDGSDGVTGRIFYLDCWTSNGTVYNQIAVSYVSDTQIKAWLVTTNTAIKQLNIYGVKVDASLSGRSADI